MEQRKEGPHMIEELLQEIQAYLRAEHETSDETQEYERLLAEFYQIPSYVERRREEEQR